MTTKANGKYRRIDRKCPCGGFATVCDVIRNGSEKRKWVCNKCDKEWNKGEVKKWEKILVK